MTKRKLTLLLTVWAVAIAPGILTAADKVVQVDCSKGESIGAALENKAAPLVIEILGVCQEEVVVRRDNVTLRGGAPGAAIIGPDPPAVPFRGAVTVDGASGIVVTDLELRDGRRGMTITNGGAAVLERVTLQDNGSTGLTLLDSSTVQLTDCVAQRNGRFGLAIWDNSHLDLRGTVSAHENSLAGILLSTSHAAGSSLTVSVEANDNGVAGVFMQIGATAQTEFVTNDNGFAGLYMISSGECSCGIEASGNDWGVFLEHGAIFSGGGTIADNACFAVFSHRDSSFFFSGDISGNPCGLILDGTEGAFDSSTVSDHLSLSFGTTVDFAGTNSLTGGVSCDDTVLTKGDVSCPSPLTGAGSQAARAVLAASATRPAGAPFRLEE